MKNHHIATAALGALWMFVVLGILTFVLPPLFNSGTLGLLLAPVILLVSFCITALLYRFIAQYLERKKNEEIAATRRTRAKPRRV
jgi:peptidoglycan/LPS O-acetylase OafA/YrhL